MPLKKVHIAEVEVSVLSETKKIYVLDTNILLQNANAILGFADNEVVITATTLQELDSLKTAPGETGFRAREAIRAISRLSERGDFLNGISINEADGESGLFRIEPNGTKVSLLPNGFTLDKADNRIINSSLTIKKESERPVFLITNDVSMRVNASICGLDVQGYRNDQVEQESTYNGRSVVQVAPSVMQKLYRTVNSGYKNPFNFNEISHEKLAYTPELNEYVTFVSGTELFLARYIGHEIETGCELEDAAFFVPVRKDMQPMGITPRNCAQRMALDALLAPPEDVPLVILKGAAGTAKTFLSLAAGLQWTLGKKYDKMMITRTNTLSDADIGFLPGTLEEKMGPLVAPFMDNLESILRCSGEESDQIKLQIEDFFETGVVEICSVAYMRGRSLTHTYLIIDEAQNATIGQVLEIVTRAGEGTKVILCGDPDQIDNPRLDRLNNGLAFAAERMKGSKLCAQITFNQDETVRSKLAAEGAIRLTQR